MKVVGLCGSARRDGNTEVLMRAVFDALGNDVDTELVRLLDWSISPCQACFGCAGKGRCVMLDDFNEVFSRMLEADGVVLASPAYSANVSSRMQAFLERAAVVLDTNAEAKLMRYTVGAAISPARRAGALSTCDAMTRFFLNHEMLVVGSSYWNVGYGAIPDEVQHDDEALKTMETLGKDMKYVLMKMKG